MAVKALLHYALEVPDQGAGEKFYSNFGLIGGPGRDGRVGLRPAQFKVESVLLYGGRRKRLHHLAFGAPGDEYAATREAVRRAGIREVDPPRGAPEGGFWVRDGDGNLVNIRDEGRVVPPPDAPLSLNSPGHIAREVRRGCPDAGLGARPRRLGHVLLFTGDLERQLDFYTRVLGMKLTDRSRQVIAFLRCTTDHHNPAFLCSKGPGCRHGRSEVGIVDWIPMDGRIVLVTGMSGLMGRGVRRQLGARYELRALNRRAVDGVPCHQADIVDLAAIEPAFKGVDAVVHLAASVGSSAPFDELLRANVIGTYNVFEASRRAGVRRVVYASSGATVSAYERDMPYRALAEGRYDEVGAGTPLTHETPQP